MKFTNSCDGCFKDSLDVRFTKCCDNACAFCIERHGIDGKPTNVKKLIESTKLSGKKDILILGGEPLLKIKDVLEYVKGIRPFVEHIYITTSLPITILQEKEIFDEIMSLIDGLNVSLQHYLPTINNAVLNAKSKHNRLELLGEICKNEDHAKKVRVSINLVKGYIDSKYHIDVFLCVMKELNVQHVKINELQNEPNLYVSFEDVYDYKMKSPYAHGCQTDITLKNHENLRITLKRGCFCVNDDLTANVADVTKAIIKSTICKDKNPCGENNVLYEDGRLSSGWETK